MRHLIAAVIAGLILLTACGYDRGELADLQNRVDELEAAESAPTPSVDRIARCGQMVREMDLAMDAIQRPVEILRTLIAEDRLEALSDAEAQQTWAVIAEYAGVFGGPYFALPEDCADFLESGAMTTKRIGSQYRETWAGLVFLVVACPESLAPRGLDCNLSL